MDKDNLVLAQSTENQDSPDEPFLEKKLIYQMDSNGSSNYSINEITFDTSSWSSAGAFINHREGFMLIPMMFKVESNNNIPDNIQLKLKSDNLHFINSFSVEYNSSPVVQSNPEISHYLDFLKRTTCSFDDTELFSHTGFRNNSKLWDFDEDYGLYTSNVASFPSKFYESKSSKEQLYGLKYDQTSGINYIDRNDPKNHYYYYNCFIRLKDLPFMNSMTLTRGAKMKLLMTLNQMDISFTRQSDTTVKQSLNKKGSFCPFMIDMINLDTFLSSTNDYLKITCSVAEIDTKKHSVHQARLYAPAYTLSPLVKKSMETNPQRKLVFNDVLLNHIRRVPAKGSFNYLVNNSISRVKRLIILPIISANTAVDKNDGNGTLLLDNLSSPFCEAGPSPCTIDNFNVSISGLNVYTTNKKYKFETYLDELDCSYGAEGGLQDGQSTSIFNLEDYENNHNYIVVDLSRKFDFDEKQSVSVEISGELKSQRDFDFLCYLEIEKDLTLDVYTGEKL